MKFSNLSCLLTGFLSVVASVQAGLADEGLESSLSIRDRDLAVNPLRTPGDILEFKVATQGHVDQIRVITRRKQSFVEGDQRASVYRYDDEFGLGLGYCRPGYGIVGTDLTATSNIFLENSPSNANQCCNKGSLNGLHVWAEKQQVNVKNWPNKIWVDYYRTSEDDNVCVDFQQDKRQMRDAIPRDTNKEYNSYMIQLRSPDDVGDTQVAMVEFHGQFIQAVIYTNGGYTVGRPYSNGDNWKYTDAEGRTITPHLDDTDALFGRGGEDTYKDVRGDLPRTHELDPPVAVKGGDKVRWFKVDCSERPVCTEAPTLSPTADPANCPAVRPKDGEACNFEGTCPYGRETCCGKNYPSYKANCRDNGLANVFPTDACLNKVCPCPAVQPNTGDACNFEGTCPYGEETCCGQTYTSYKANCRDNGEVNVFPTDACLNRVCPTESPTLSPTLSNDDCPAVQPNIGDACNFEGVCPYGEETCCGETHTSYNAMCDNGHVNGVNTDACLNKVCPTESPTLSPTADPGPPASSGGDPHFRSWSGKNFDFHGGCDLVLLQNPDFANGLGLNVHIRTSIETWWSYIDSAAVRIGEHTLEIKGGTDTVSYWIDGEKTVNMETGDAALGDYSIHFRRISPGRSQARVDLRTGRGSHKGAISIETFKHFVRVNFKAPAEEGFAGGVGMLGSYPDGKLVGRDNTVFVNTDEFGMEWQVRATDPQLFHSPGPVQHPMQCVMPDQTKRSQARRRLGAAAITEEDAALACAHVSEYDKDACIFDVIATNDKDMAGSY